MTRNDNNNTLSVRYTNRRGPVRYARANDFNWYEADERDYSGYGALDHDFPLKQWLVTDLLRRFFIGKSKIFISVGERVKNENRTLATRPACL